MLYCVANNFTLSAFLWDSDLMFLLKAFAFSVFLSMFCSPFGYSLLRCTEGGVGSCLDVVLFKVGETQLRSLWVLGDQGKERRRVCLVRNKMRESKAGSVQLRA